MHAHAIARNAARKYVMSITACIILLSGVCLGIIAWPDASSAATTNAVLVQPSTGGYLGSALELGQRKTLASKGVEPYKSAYSDVVSFANGKLGSSPSPQNPLNIPGTTGPFVDDTAAAYGLALAYSSTGDVKYAQKSRDYIMAWVNTTKSTSNTCPGSASSATQARNVSRSPGAMAGNMLPPVARIRRKPNWRRVSCASSIRARVVVAEPTTGVAFTSCSPLAGIDPGLGRRSCRRPEPWSRTRFRC